jgi:hypothetical protein
MSFDSPHFIPGTSVVLWTYPRGPVLTTLKAHRDGTEWLYSVAWIDHANRRCQAEYHERDLVRLHELEQMRSGMSS